MQKVVDWVGAGLAVIGVAAGVAAVSIVSGGAAAGPAIETGEKIINHIAQYAA